MLKVKTYISLDSRWYNNPPLSIEEYPKYVIEFIKANKNKLAILDLERRYYGFIDIQYNSQHILDSAYFGTITDIWMVYTQLVEGFLKDGKGTECYPDYECYITLEENKHNGITLKIGNETKQYDINPKDFCKEILKGAKDFIETYDFVKEKEVYSSIIEKDINPLLSIL